MWGEETAAGGTAGYSFAEFESRGQTAVQAAEKNAKGLKGITFDSYPKGFASLLRSYCGVYDLTAEAVLHKKKEYVIQALHACPMVHSVRNLAELVDVMIQRQNRWLGYLA